MVYLQNVPTYVDMLRFMYTVYSNEKYYYKYEYPITMTVGLVCLIICHNIHRLNLNQTLSYMILFLESFIFRMYPLFENVVS